MKNILILFLTLLLVSSCSNPKKKFLREYHEITTHIIENSDNFTDNEWSISLEQYLALRKEYYNFSAELTESEKEEIHELNKQVNQAMSGYKIESLKGSILSIFDEVKSLFYND